MVFVDVAEALFVSSFGTTDQPIILAAIVLDVSRLDGTAEVDEGLRALLHPDLRPFGELRCNLLHGLLIVPVADRREIRRRDSREFGPLVGIERNLGRLFLQTKEEGSSEVVELTFGELLDGRRAQDGLGFVEPTIGLQAFDARQPRRLRVRNGTERLDDLAFADGLAQLVGNANAKLPDVSTPRKSGHSGHLLVASCSAVV